MSKVVTEGVYLCDAEKNIACHGPLHSFNCLSECRHTLHPEYARNPRSVDIYSKMIETFDVDITHATDETIVVSFIEKEKTHEQ